MKRAFTIYYDEDSMELSKVDIAPVFESQYPLGKADVLQDCIGAITELYHQAMEDIPIWMSGIGSKKG